MAYAGLIIGLGNPGTQYARTRHNFGFMLLDCLLAFWAQQPGTACVERSFQNARVWDVSEDYGARRWVLAKPQTFMNLSGQAVVALSHKYSVDVEHILVLHDELDLPLGTVRFKFSGGLAGHNGLKSIAACLGSRDFVRLRLGVGHPAEGMDVAGYVLRSFPPEEQSVAEQELLTGREAVLDFCRNGLAAATARLHSC